MAVLTQAPARPMSRRFGSWSLRPALLIAAAVVAGMAASLLFVWPDSGNAAEPTFADILAHNAALAAILVIGTPYVAWPAVVFNSFFLGFVIQASGTAHGWGETAQLTAAHVPLEVLAWLVTLWCSVLLADLVASAWHTRERPARRELAQLSRAGSAATALYLAAAGAEWLELWLTIQGGNPT